MDVCIHVHVCMNVHVCIYVLYVCMYVMYKSVYNKGFSLPLLEMLKVEEDLPGEIRGVALSDGPMEVEE